MTAAPAVAVIDSGVDAAHPDVRGRGTVLAGATFAADGTATPGGGDCDRLGHGTAIAAAILRHAPGLDLLPLKVFDTAPECPFAAVLAALAFALQQRVPVVNLSLGTLDRAFAPPLQALLATARSLGTRIVAPATAAGLPCLPGVLDGVDAVVADANVPAALPVLRPAGGRAFWYANPQPVQVAHRARGESLACAYVTAALLRRR